MKSDLFAICLVLVVKLRERAKVMARSEMRNGDDKRKVKSQTHG
jgi:hypothetical protein